jgi:uncharacterized protein YjbJ (UPF0337 family)
MNKDQMKGAMKDMAGNVQRRVGQAMDDPKTALKGAAKQAEGKIQKAAGDMRESARDVQRESRKRGKM